MERILPISVVVPVFNGAQYLAEALESVLYQEARPLEILVVDDGSTDDSISIAERYPVKVIRQRNKGISGARNTGILAAKADWIALLDQDDIWCRDKLTKQWFVLQENRSIDLIFGDTFSLRDGKAGKPAFDVRKLLDMSSVIPLGGNGYLLDSDSLCNLIKNGNVITPSTLLVRNDLIGSELFDETMVRAEDRDLFLRLFPKATVAMINEPIIYYRLHDNNNSLDNVKMLLGTVLLTRKVLRNRIKYSDTVYDYFRNNADSLYYNMASILLRSGDKLESRKLFYESLESGFSVKALLKLIMTFF